MERYPYKQAAIFSSEEDARRVQKRISDVDFEGTLVLLLSPVDLAGDEHKLEPEGDEIARTVVRRALYGGTGGALTGAAASVAAGAFKLTLFISHPVLASLVAIGYGTAFGATGGALAGEKIKEDMFIGALEDALKHGQWAVIIHTPDKETTQKVKVMLEHVHGVEEMMKN